MLKGKCHCGDVSWTLADMPESATACNCTVCRRYGVLWAYGYIGDDINTYGRTTTYRRKDGGSINFHFCAKCGCVTYYVKIAAGEDGHHRTAVNLRLSDPTFIFDLPIDHFDGHDSFEELPRDGHTVRDLWF